MYTLDPKLTKQEKTTNYIVANKRYIGIFAWYCKIDSANVTRKSILQTYVDILEHARQLAATGLHIDPNVTINNPPALTEPIVYTEPIIVTGIATSATTASPYTFIVGSSRYGPANANQLNQINEERTWQMGMQSQRINSQLLQNNYRPY